MPFTADEFDAELRRQFQEASGRGLPYLEVNAGQLHRELGGYPGKQHGMPTCCLVMQRHLSARDRIISSPPKGKGASLTIRYALPR